MWGRFFNVLVIWDKGRLSAKLVQSEWEQAYIMWDGIVQNHAGISPRKRVNGRTLALLYRDPESLLQGAWLCQYNVRSNTTDGSALVSDQPGYANCFPLLKISKPWQTRQALGRQHWRPTAGLKHAPIYLQLSERHVTHSSARVGHVTGGRLLNLVIFSHTTQNATGL